MKLLGKIVLGLLFACTGCQTVAPQKPVWEQIKLKELAAAKHSPSAQKTLEPPFQFNVYMFNVPANNFALIKAAWADLDTKPISFKSKESFSENGFLAGVGQPEAWPPTAEKLGKAASKNPRTVELIMADNSPERVWVMQIDGEKNIFYKTQNGQLSGATVGPGKAFFRLTAATIPDMRGVCKLTVEPAFSTEKSNVTAGGPEEVNFDSMPFTARMAQGDFLLLGPATTSQEMALGSIFFSTPDKPSAQIYLIVCVRVNN